MQPLSGDDPVQIGRYRLRGRLGAGGMGRVYLASTPAGRSVALKVVRPELGDDQEFRARFQQEIQAAQRVRGLYTAELVDADPDATPPWLATAYVPGESLQQAVDTRGPLPETEAFRLIAGIAEALQAIHSANVVHRDLKPSNVVLGPDGPRVIDFGIARALEAATLTRTGMTVGTPQFMAPEQLLNELVTPLIDIFALGSLAAYAVLGRSPFAGGHPAAVAYRILREPPDLNGCPQQVRALIEPCLAKQPADRPSLAQIIQFCLEGAAAAPQHAQAREEHRPSELAIGRHRQAPPSAPPTTAYVAPQPPAAGAPAGPVPPPPVLRSLRLIRLGCLLTVCGGILNLLDTVPAIRATLPQAPANEPGGVEIAAFTMLISLVGACLWLGTAKTVQRGWRGARGTAAVLLAVSAVTVYGTNANGDSTHLSLLFGLAEWGVGLLAVVFLWDWRSGQYFAGLRQAGRRPAPGGLRRPGRPGLARRLKV
jgi:hypothetical protein